MKVNLLEGLSCPEELIFEYGDKIAELGHEFEFFENKTTDPEELYTRAKDADIIMIANNPLSGEVIKRLDKLKYINVAFTGVDHVGLEEVKERGILLSNASGYSNTSVAEMAIALTLDLYRNVSLGDREIRQGGLARKGKEIRGKKVAIIGTGNIGLETARIFKAFGAELLGYSRTERQEFKDLGGRYLDLDLAFQEADIISIHLPSNKETKGLIGEHLINQMKKDAILINCARGAIVDNEALAYALNEGNIMGAGIDVFDMEPPIPADYCLLHAKNIVLSPHVAFLTEEAMVRRCHIAFENTLAYLQGSPKNLLEL